METTKGDNPNNQHLQDLICILGLQHFLWKQQDTIDKMAVTMK